MNVLLPDTILILLGHAVILLVLPTLVMWAILIPVMKRWKRNYSKKHPFGDCDFCHGSMPSVRQPGVCEACTELELLKEYNVEKITPAPTNHDNKITAHSLTVLVHHDDLLKCTFKSMIVAQHKPLHLVEDKFHLVEYRQPLATVKPTILIYEKSSTVGKSMVLYKVKVEVTPPSKTDQCWHVERTKYINGLSCKPVIRRRLHRGERAVLELEEI